MTLKNRTYDILKAIALVWLPAIAALYVGLAQVWGDVFPYPEQIAGTIALIETFLGSILQLSTKNYWEAIDADIK